MKISTKQFEIFKAECQKWIAVFGLINWEFHFKHKEMDNGNIAFCYRDLNNHVAELSLCKTWPDEPVILLNEGAIRKAAFEEVCHVFLYRLSSNAFARFIMEHEIHEAEHAIIRVLQGVLMK